MGIVQPPNDHEYRWKRILLVKPNFTTMGWDFYNMDFPPINLTYIASYLSDLDVKVEILDAKVNKFKIKQIKKRIKEFKPDLVGISVFVSAAIKESFKIAQAAKEIDKNITVVFGGRHPTFEPEESLKNGSVDLVVRGEGELTFRELIIKGTPDGVEGISYRRNGAIIHNDNRALMSKEEYKNIRVPKRSLTKGNDYRMFTVRLETIETSRGCPFSCKFCTTWKINNRTYRTRPVEKVIDELKLISKMGRVTDVFFVDDELGANTKRVERMCDRIIECKERGEMRDLKFFAQIRVDDLVRSPTMVEKMAKAGFWVVFIGIESVDEESLREMRKGITFNKVLEALKILHKHNIVAIGNLIIGVNLHDTEEDVKRQIEIMQNVDVDIISFVLLTPFPGSDTLEELDEQGLVITKDWTKYTVMEPVIKTHELSPRQLYELLYLSFRKLKYLNNPRKLLNRVLRTRGISFLLKPQRIISAIKSYLQMRSLFQVPK